MVKSSHIYNAGITKYKKDPYLKVFFSAVSSSIHRCEKWGTGSEDRKEGKELHSSVLFASCNICNQKRERHGKQQDFYL